MTIHRLAVSLAVWGLVLGLFVISWPQTPRVMKPVHAQAVRCDGNVGSQLAQTFNGAGCPTSGGGCAQATTYLARLTAPSANDQTGMTTTICNMVMHGTFTKLDYYYQFALNSSTNALINVPNSTYSGTANNSPTFTSEQGYTGNGSNAWVDSGFNPNTAGGNWTQNCAAVGYYGLTSRTSSTFVNTGANDGTHYAYISTFDSGPDVGSSINDGNFLDVASGGANANGAWTAFRDSSSSTITFYHNGTSLTTGSSNSNGLVNKDIAALANNGNTVTNATSDQVAAIFGGCLTAAQVANVQNDINGGIMTQLGINKY